MDERMTMVWATAEAMAPGRGGTAASAARPGSDLAAQGRIRTLRTAFDARLGAGRRGERFQHLTDGEGLRDLQ